ncbi:MAG: helix-turn-helix transcriptional regulator [Gemmataceae bacterium]|nr:helix-turn-helix transcriptional regulator [Gemmataceae bacterium]
MSKERVFKKIDWTPEDRARHKAIREKFQRERPTMEQLLASGEYVGPIPLEEYFQFQVALHDLKAARESAGLSLADVAERSGIDKAALSRLENGVHHNPTILTLVRYAAAVGKKLTWRLEDLAPAG